MLKKLAMVVLLGASLGGCAEWNAVTGAISVATTPITNPITPQREAQVEAAVSVIFTALNAYRDACEAGTADKRCWDNIAAIQVYTRQLPPYVRQLRAFVRSGDQVSALQIYNQLMTLRDNAVNTARALGVNVGA